MLNDMACRITPSTKHVLITGIPGVGKTTLMSKIHEELKEQSIKCSGFITEEVQIGGKRAGFDIVTLTGERGILARISDVMSNAPTPRQREFKVGQYNVNLLAFEQTALCTLKPPPQGQKKTKHVYLVDEIGRMELFSQSFIQAVKKLISHPDVTLIATIPVPKGRPIPFVEELRGGQYSTVFEVTRQNRGSIAEEIMASVKECIAL